MRSLLPLLVVVVGCGAAAAPQQPTVPAQPVTPAPTGDRPAADAKAPSGSRVYARADLEALERQQSWSELVEHLEDIPPAERDDKWKALVAKSVVALLAATKGDQGSRVARARQVEAVQQRYPSLRTSPAFLDARSDVYVAAITDCNQQNYWPRCDWLATAYEGDPKHALAGGRAAGINRHLAMSLYRVALAGDAAAVCNDNDALGTMLQGVASPRDGQFYKDAAAIQERCRELKAKK
jgi:hypothetical protein